MVAQDILVVLVLVRTQVSQPKTAPENHFRGCLYFTTIRTLSVYLGSTYIRCGHIYTPSRHEIKRHTTLRQTRLILPLFFSAANDFSICWERFSGMPTSILRALPWRIVGKKETWIFSGGCSPLSLLLQTVFHPKGFASFRLLLYQYFKVNFLTLHPSPGFHRDMICGIQIPIYKCKPLGNQ